GRGGGARTTHRATAAAKTAKATSAAAGEPPPMVNASAHEGEPATHCPATTTNRMSATPMKKASSTRPGRKNRKYTPSSSAIGIVIASVNVAHGDDFSAFTITSATTPSRITMIASTAS